jgi:chromosome segregation protein
LQFTRLRVLGFKSFVEPTEFLIEPGLTGVVGPNGCGKSNLVEALRWVMGEASYKNMRASGMDDVIFSGSGSRPARNTAEVSLLADNTDRTAPAGMNDSDTLEITRRIEREAGSVYRLNGRDVRARDIQLLFADASTGAHSPAMVGQGRIGELIAAKPTDRRKLLEEAAGISGLHNRRHEAELRLRAAETNLERLADVISEIEAQLETLKRQARQAVRYRNLSGDIRRAEATALHLRWMEAKQVVTTSASEHSQSGAVTATRELEQAQAARQQAEAAAMLPDLRDAAASAGAAVQRITLAQESLNAEQDRVTARLSALDRHLSELGADIDRERKMVDENQTILDRLSTEEQDLETVNTATAQQRSGALKQREAAEQTLRQSENELATLTNRLAEITAARAQIERSIGESSGRATRLNSEITALKNRIEALGPADLNDQHVADKQKASATAAEASEAAETGVAAAEADLVTRREAATQSREALSLSQQTVNRIDTEISTLDAFLATDPQGQHEPVLDRVKVKAGYEAALGAAFGDELDAPVDESAAAHWRRIEGGTEALPAAVEPLARYVDAPPELTRSLQQTGLVDRATGRDLQPLLKPGQRLVTREGDLWRWDGYVTAADAGHSAARRLAARNRLTELREQAEPARLEASQRRATLEEAQQRMGEASETEKAARESLRLARRQFDEARDALAAAERQGGRITAQRSAFEESVTRLLSEFGETDKALETAREELATAPDADGLADGLEATRRKVGEDRTGLADARAASENLSREAELRSGRMAAIAVERQNWRERAINADAQIATLARRRDELETEKTSLSSEPAKIEAKRRELMSQIANAETTRSAAADKLAVGENVLKEADGAARETLDKLAAAREQRGRAEERAVAARNRLQEVERLITEALDCPPEEVLEIAELKPDKPLPDLANTEARLERYRRERERLGAVNLRADVEAGEIAERRDIMVSERDDLLAAIQRLRQGIASLNREGRERLLAAFETVNEHFQTLFTHLFGGGTAKLELTESDDPLEAGLEIVARPPGKKPQLMTLLSGGEQALTALSLIFAVFLTNPAPICVLDEVDAPLDDANVERFCNLLDRMSGQTKTRFVVITHNPITMARMNRLFGVTMAERGISQIVSVDLETAETYREAG